MKRSIELRQDLGQDLLDSQSMNCNSSDNTLKSCNNVALSTNGNNGNNAVGQQ